MPGLIAPALLTAFLSSTLALGSLVGFSSPAHADQGTARDEILDTYQSFAAAQNARDLEAVGDLFVDGPDFLWVSDGQSFWGRDAVIARMGSFQKAERWHVTPGLDAARVVDLADGLAMLHMPLTLEVGRAEAPNRLPFLVSILFHEMEGEWRIAALLTTNDKQRQH